MRSDAPSDRQLLPVSETCALLRVSRATLDRLIKDGSITVVRIRGTRRVPLAEIDRLISENSAEGA